MSSVQRVGLSPPGVVCALGNNCHEVLKNFRSGHAPGLSRQSGWLPDSDILTAAVQMELPTIPNRLADFDCRNNRLLAAALEQIQDAIDDAIDCFGRRRVAVVIGSSTSGIFEGERALAGEGHRYHYRQQEIGTPALFVARTLQLQSIAYTVSTACSSAAKAFISARQLLQLGICDAVIVGGSDSLCKLTLNGFTALESVSAAGCNPFSANRDGITIGEGSALFVMRRDQGQVFLAGAGESSDAHHISAPHPEGTGAIAAMNTALQDATLNATQIDYLNLHGTATQKNDAMESTAVNSVLGKHVPCSSSKSLTGHTLGAAGAIEAALCCLLILNRGTLPAQVWDGEYDASLANIALLNTPVELPKNSPLHMMSNSFAFGGSNACLIFGSENGV